MKNSASRTGCPESGGVSPKDSGRPARGLSGRRLKIIAGIMLFFQVASTAMVSAAIDKDFQDTATLTLAAICELASWAAIPIHAWLLVEGFRKTQAFGMYLGRLGVLALLREVPYDLVTFGRPWDFGSQNPVWVLGLALIVLRLMKLEREKYWARSTVDAIVSEAVVMLAGVLWALLLCLGTRQGLMPIGAILMITVVIFYLLELRENTMTMLAGLVGALALMAPAIGVAFLHYRNDTKGHTDLRTGWWLYAIYLVELLVGSVFAVIS